MIAALLVLLVILALFGWGIGGAVHFLIWIAVILFVLWLLGWFLGGVAGGPRGYWRR